VLVYLLVILMMSSQPGNAQVLLNHPLLRQNALTSDADQVTIPAGNALLVPL